VIHLVIKEMGLASRSGGVVGVEERSTVDEWAYIYQHYDNDMDDETEKTFCCGDCICDCDL